MDPRVYLLVSLLTALLLAGQSQGDVTLLVPTTEGRIDTRTGCDVTITCSGVTQGLEWRRFGQHDALQSSGNRNVTTKKNTTLMHWRSDVQFIPITFDDRGAYTCEIQDPVLMDKSTTKTVLLVVTAEPVEITPPIENMDISTRVIGEQASIGCSVATCAEQVTVKLMKGSVLIEEGLLTGTASQKVYNFVLTVDENTPGTYACKADIAGSTDMQEFNITGTPLSPGDPTPPVTTSQTVAAIAPTATTTDSPGPTFTPTTPTSATTEPDDALSVMVHLPVLSLLLILASALLIV